MATVNGGTGSDNLAGIDELDVLDGPSGNDFVGGDGIATLFVDTSRKTQSVQLMIAGNPRFFVRSGCMRQGSLLEQR